MNHPIRARNAALLTAVAALALLPAAPASAHDELLKADPADGATVTRLTKVDLTFAEPLVDLGGQRNGITITDSAGRHFETACAKVTGDHLVAPVAIGGGGEYRVQWRGVSEDGHVVGNTYAFTYRPASGAATAAGSTTGPACGATDVAVAEESATGGGVDGGAIAAGAIAGGSALIVVGVVLLLVLRSRAAQDAEADR